MYTVYIYIQYSPIQLMYLFENLFSCKVSGCFSPCVFPLSSHSVLPKCQGINRTRTCRGVSRCCENFRCFPAQENSSVRQPETKHMVILLDSKKTEQKQWWFSHEKWWFSHEKWWFSHEKWWCSIFDSQVSWTLRQKRSAQLIPSNPLRVHNLRDLKGITVDPYMAHIHFTLNNIPPLVYLRC